MNRGDALPGGATIASLAGSVMITAANTVVFWCLGGSGGSGDAAVKPFPEQKNFYGIFTTGTSDLGTGTKLILEPKLSIPFNIVEYIEELEAIDAALHALGGELAFGPTLWLGFPVAYDVQSVAVDAFVCNLTNSLNTPSKLIGTPADPTATFPADPKNLNLTLGYSTGFDFGIGIYGEVSILKIFSLGGEYDFPGLLALLGISPAGGSYTHTLTQTIGTKLTAAMISPPASSGGACNLSTNPPRVVLAPPPR